MNGQRYYPKGHYAARHRGELIPPRVLASPYIGDIKITPDQYREFIGLTSQKARDSFLAQLRQTSSPQ